MAEQNEAIYSPGLGATVYIETGTQKEPAAGPTYIETNASTGTSAKQTAIVMG